MASEFLSDNIAGAHPTIVSAFLAANEARDTPYGTDGLSQRLNETFSTLFEREVAVVPCLTGTAANALALSLFAGPTNAICVHGGSHVYGDECNAPEFFTGGARLTPIEGAGGKLTPQELAQSVKRRDDVHAAQTSAISFAQANERGSIYSLAEIRGLGDFARRYGLKLHMDGARFANAIASIACTPAEMTWMAGVDVLSFGATKNGCFAAEAVILFDLGRAEELRYRAKRAGQLVSKMRYLSAQLIAYVDSGLWLSNARHANEMALRLAKGLKRQGIESCEMPEANMVFASLPRPTVARLELEGIAGYVDQNGLVRLCTNWNTSAEDVDRLLAVVEVAADAAAATDQD